MNHTQLIIKPLKPKPNPPITPAVTDDRTSQQRLTDIHTNSTLPDYSNDILSAQIKFCKKFASMEDDKILNEIVKCYAEINTLAQDVNASPNKIEGNPQDLSPSQKKFGVKHDEFDRTFNGIMALKWILAGDYKQFVSVQNEYVKLSKGGFNTLQVYIKSVIKTSEDINAMIISMVINDLGKVKSFIKTAKLEYGITEIDHDKILLGALRKNPRVSPSFFSLKQEYQDIILNGLETGFNLGQLLQCENVAASLSKLNKLSSLELDFLLIHAFLDIAGVGGNVKHGGCLIATQPLFDSFECAKNALRKNINNISNAYNAFIDNKAKIYGITTEDIRKKVALVKLSSLIRLNTKEEVQKLSQHFENIDENIKNKLIEELNISGLDGEVAILIYYSPAIVSNIKVHNSKDRLNGLGQQSINDAIYLLERIYRDSREFVNQSEYKGRVFTIHALNIANYTKNSYTNEKLKAILENTLPFEFKRAGNYDASISIIDDKKDN
ncbi:MAG: hypothetical protein RLZZ210_1775 [Pseudomonadota bacterium]|jgi:hypothetical protein